MLRNHGRDFPGGPVAKILHPNAWGLGSIPGQGTKSHMPQLESLMLQLKIPHATVLCAQSLSPVQLFATPWTAARQAPLSMGILQARILEWVAMPFSRGSSQPRGRTQVSLIAGRFFTHWATRDTHNKDQGPHVP